jgi:hypothetical protein
MVVLHDLFTAHISINKISLEQDLITSCQHVILDMGTEGCKSDRQ